MSESDASRVFEPLRLGALERQVMNVLWDLGASTIRSVIDNLSSDPAYTTIATVLGNLVRKELVIARRCDRSVHYSSRHTREEYAALLMCHALDSSTNHAASMLHFVQAISPSDLDLLRTYLRDGTDRRE